MRAHKSHIIIKAPFSFRDQLVRELNYFATVAGRLEQATVAIGAQVSASHAGSPALCTGQRAGIERKDTRPGA